MKNFAEELTYWYLRFNGFFPLTNFVLHNQGLSSNQSADADLLAVRPKYVWEEIGGDHLDSKIFDHFSNNINIGVICEVKSGQRISLSDIPITREDRLNYALRRLGFFSEGGAEIHMKKLKSNKVIRGKFHEVGKILITEGACNHPGFICITLDQVEVFITERIRLYESAKGGAKHFFESDMLQYMIWKRQRNRRE
ncbi:hypothetical protein [Cohnella sp.]|uniref:hypothetical protein n=1 Tax=Cohnella sp. TaxID=1883426 RepID=UPI0037037F5F